jgi:hypothetical protein
LIGTWTYSLSLNDDSAIPFNGVISLSNNDPVESVTISIFSASNFDSSPDFIPGEYELKLVADLTPGPSAEPVYFTLTIHPLVSITPPTMAHQYFYINDGVDKQIEIGEYIADPTGPTDYTWTYLVTLSDSSSLPSYISTIIHDPAVDSVPPVITLTVSTSNPANAGSISIMVTATLYP